MPTLRNELIEAVIGEIFLDTQLRREPKTGPLMRLSAWNSRAS